MIKIVLLQFLKTKLLKLFVLEEQQKCIAVLFIALHIDHWIGAVNYSSRLAHR